MNDLTSAPSDGASEDIAVVESAGDVTQLQDSPVPANAKDAVDQAFDEIFPEESRAVQNRKPDGKFAKGKTEVPVTPTEPTDPVVAAAPQFDVSELSNFGLTKEALEAAQKADPKLLSDMKRRFTELTQGIEKHKQGSESWSKGQKFQEMARASGRDVWEVFDQYVNMENVLRDRPLEGFVHLAQRLGMNPAELGNALVQMAQGQPYQAPQAQFDPNALLSDIDSKLEMKLRERDALNQITEFKKEHPRFDELSEVIGTLLENKIAKDLPDAYAKAELLNPAALDAPAVTTPAAPQTPAAQPTAPAVQPAPATPEVQTKAKLSISPSTPSGSTRKKTPGTARNAVDEAFDELGI